MIFHHYDRRVIRRQRSGNPRLRLLMYVDMMSSDPRDPAGVADWVGYRDASRNHPDWFLRDASGRPLVFKDYPTSRVMDVGNAVYQAAGAARVIRWAKADGFDGDDANASLRASVGYTREVWWPEYATAASLGRPLGGYRVLPGGVYRRDFSDGVVLVKPGLRRTRRIRLGGTYSGSGLRRVKAVSLERTSGLVLAGH